MKTKRLAVLLLAPLLFACGPAETDPPPPPPPTPLDTFVADTTGYGYEPLWSTTENGVESHVLNVTSQIWRSEEEVDRTEWWHDVAVVWPEGADTRLAIVVVSGGSNGSHMEPGDSDVADLATVALLTNTPVIGIGQIPNQPLTIAGQGEARREDDLVAATWDRVVETGDPTWSAYFAMTRAVVRCLDAVQDYMAQNGTPIDDFVVTGFSKRGATTWLVGAADPRVVAIAPGVFDFLNFRPQARHHLDVYGEPAPAVQPYAEYDLLARIDDPAADVLIQTSDPYAYLDRFSMPKLVMASPGDQFFLPDAMRYYLDDLPGETLVRYVPNSDHSLAQPDGDFMGVLLTLSAWYGTVRDEEDRPSVSWALEGDTLTMTAEPTPTSVKLWTATNPDARNFRRDAVGPIWEAQGVSAAADGIYAASVPAPEQGFTAFFLEATFGAEIYTTQVYVTPDE